ncbi:MAG: hypothetical protein IAE90_14645, partial [Ignavibacteria bacterium]|nr:hypothetical protein [Ignavibacteria bacterium]
AELDPDTLPGLVFSWTPLPKGGPYTLKIVELKGDQSPDVAIKENRPILDKEGITSTSFQYPFTGPKLEAGKKYAWRVSSGDVQSDVRIIKGPPIHPTNPNEPGISLVSPTNGQEIDSDTLLGIVFSWKRNDPCPPHVICKYTLRIVELKGDQSPDVAIKENRPILEVNDIKSTTYSYAGDPPGVVVKRGYKYAWQITSGDDVSEIRGMMLMLSMQNNKK